jgi:hypothetical protein
METLFFPWAFLIWSHRGGTRDEVGSWPLIITDLIKSKLKRESFIQREANRYIPSILVCLLSSYAICFKIKFLKYDSDIT